jgi:hypothetical protein
MSSVISTVETDVKDVSNTVATDLKAEVTRLTGLLEKAKVAITTQASTIASHVDAAATSSNTVSQAAATLKAASDDFEKVLSNAAIPAAVAVAATVIPAAAPALDVAAAVIPTVINTVAGLANSAQTVTVTSPAPPANTPVVNAVITALDEAVHAGGVAPTLHNLQALEEAYAKLMTNATTSNSAAVPTPPQVTAIVQAAQTTSSGVVNRVESVVETAKTEAEKLASGVEAGVKNVAEGNVTIGPLHI